MKIIIPNVEGLPERHLINFIIKDLNKITPTDQKFSANTVAAISLFLAERPEIILGQDWVNRASQLVQGIETNPVSIENIYSEFIKHEKEKLQDTAKFALPRKVKFYFMAFAALALSGLILYKIYIVYKSTGEVIPGDILLFIAPLALAILLGVMGYKTPPYKQA